MSNNLLAQDRVNEIKALAESKLAEAILDELDHSDILKKIAENERIRLNEADLQEISGVLYKDGESWVILVNKEDSPKRKVFTIAHELGHYFLHKEHGNEFIDGQFVQTCFGRMEMTKFQNMEIEANEFAGNLLMPRAKIEELLGEPEKAGKIDNAKITETAFRFGVSPIAMTTRLKNLNYNA